MPFLTNIKSGGNEASYSAALTETHHSMIIANYGASQGFDVSLARNRPQHQRAPHPLPLNPKRRTPPPTKQNDDGSSWYDTHDNFFYDADVSLVPATRKNNQRAP